MDDLAPAAAQRTSDDSGGVRDDGFKARKKAAKKVPPATAQNPQPQPVPAVEPAAEHELDILA